MTAVLVPQSNAPTAVSQAPPSGAPASVAADGSVSMMAVRDFFPFAVALVPFSLAIGTASAMNGLTLVQAAFGAIFLLAGTAQLAATELIGSGASVPVVVATVLLINTRFLVYGAGLARWFSDEPRVRRIALAFPLVDQTFLCCEERFETMTDLGDRRRYYLVGTSLLMTVFLSSELVGYLAGPSVPGWLGLHLAAPLAFAGMLVKAVSTGRDAAAASAAAVTVVLCVGMPGGLGLPVAIAVGIFAGTRVGRGAS